MTPFIRIGPPSFDRAAGALEFLAEDDTGHRARFLVRPNVLGDAWRLMSEADLLRAFERHRQPIGVAAAINFDEALKTERLELGPRAKK